MPDYDVRKLENISLSQTLLGKDSLLIIDGNNFKTRLEFVQLSLY